MLEERYEAAGRNETAVTLTPSHKSLTAYRLACNGGVFRLIPQLELSVGDGIIEPLLKLLVFHKLLVINFIVKGIALIVVIPGKIATDFGFGVGIID